MAFYGYKGDVDNCYWTPYTSSNFGSTPLQYSFSYETPLTDYKSSFSSSFQQEELNYSVHTFTEPQTHYYNYEETSENYYNVNLSNIYQTEPVSYTISSPIEFKVSYSVSSEFNETDFDEYDATPYGGGYDPVATYGKPLPPSDKICYPTTVPKTDTNSNFSYNSAVLNYGLGEEPSMPSIEMIRPVIEKEREAKMDNVGKVGGIEPLDVIAIDEIDKSKSIEHEKERDVKTDNVGKVGGIEPLDVIAIDEIDKSKSNEHENEVEKNQMYGYGSDHGNISYGSGLEAMDICESIFGYWPCLAKMEKREKDKLREKIDQERRDDSWNVAADYLFGSPNVYTYESYYR